ncbi:MAG: MgtC/SapB family protein [Atopostipes suicloacalis]|nr:MgtC/SapB family protein [Atopostipes suicloacalis]
MIHLSLFEIIIRILLAAVAGGIIGYNREVSGQSAGFRTHMLVALGATIIALIQIETVNLVLEIITENPDFSTVFSLNYTRLIAQIVSGVGFLGAGAIIVTKSSISGLTTAASIWATAAIGIAMGMGNYRIGILGTIVIVLILALIKNKLKIAAGESLVVRFLDKNVQQENVQQEIIHYFEENNIRYQSSEFRVDSEHGEGKLIFSERYILNVPAHRSISRIVEEIGEIESVSYASSQHNII